MNQPSPTARDHTPTLMMTAQPLAAMATCGFCTVDLDEYGSRRDAVNIPSIDWVERMKMRFWPDTAIPCERWIADGEEWFAVLDARPLKRGHSLVILKHHRNDILDASLAEFRAIAEGV